MISSRICTFGVIVRRGGARLDSYCSGLRAVSLRARNKPEEYDLAASKLAPCQPTIVLVEDSKGDAYIIQEAVAEQIPGSQVEHFEDAPAALKFLDDLDSSTAAPCPALFVVDLNLPGGWGGSVVERIRLSRCGHVPILISSSARPDSVPGLAKFGAHFFPKPSSYDEFFAIGKIIRSLIPQNAL